jgi:hypothetical protein
MIKIYVLENKDFTDFRRSYSGFDEQLLQRRGSFYVHSSLFPFHFKSIRTDLSGSSCLDDSGFAKIQHKDRFFCARNQVMIEI